MEKILRAAFCPDTQLPVWGCQGTVPATGTESKPKETGSPVSGTPNQRKRKRTLYSKWQQMELESVFEVIPYPDISTREHLAKVIRLPESKVQVHTRLGSVADYIIFGRKIELQRTPHEPDGLNNEVYQVWFQNRRARKNKSGKLHKYLYRRGSSLRAHHLYSSSASSSQGCSQRDALMPMPLPHGHPGQHVSSLQTRYPSFPQMSPPVSEQFYDKSYPQTYRQQDVQWQNVTSSPDYSYNAPLYDTQLVEAFTIPSQGSYWEMFPHTMNENGSQTSLGYLSDVIYNAAIITNLGDL